MSKQSLRQHESWHSLCRQAHQAQQTASATFERQLDEAMEQAQVIYSWLTIERTV